MKIDELLDKYFEWETSCEEERELRRFFTEEEVPEHLQMYSPLFAYLNREATSMAEPTEEKSETTESAKEVPAQRKPSRLYRTFYAVSGIAAGLLLLLGVAKIIFPLSGVPENYVVIDGQRYTDEKLVEAKALEALLNASFTDEDLINLFFLFLFYKVMKTSTLICIRSLCLFFLLICLPAFVHAQEGLQIADLFNKYGEQKDVTRVELNGSILKSYRMTTYKSLVFKNVSPYRREIQQAIVHDKQDNAKKAQEVMESGVLRSAYYQLKEVERNGKKLNRYLIFKIGKDSMGTLIYIEGLLSEKEMMDMLYKSE